MGRERTFQRLVSCKMALERGDSLPGRGSIIHMCRRVGLDRMQNKRFTGSVHVTINTLHIVIHKIN